MMNRINYPEKTEWTVLFSRPQTASSANEAAVAGIMADVKARGDAALRDYAQKFDGAELAEIRCSISEPERNGAKISDELKQAIRTAKVDIEKFHRAQLSNETVIE